jgi:hypothetical protein
VSRAAWWALCLLHLLPGLAALVAPSWFAAEVAGIPVAEPHFARDVGVGELTLAAAAALAAVRPSVRTAVALVMGVQLVLHAGSHVVDRAAADGWANALVAISLVVQAALLVVGGAPRPNRLRSRG